MFGSKRHIDRVQVTRDADGRLRSSMQIGRYGRSDPESDSVGGK